jgi:NADPH:quinone reductase-like Zn-dependent oxidoreductase
MTQSRARRLIGDGELSPVELRALPAPGPGEVLLRVHATSVNYHDLLGVNGGIPGLPKPRVPFSDASATIAALGSGVDGWRLGERVIPSFFQNWQSGPPTARALAPILGDQVDGTLQTHVCVPARSLARTPAHLTHEEAATLGCAGLTAWRSLVAEADLRPGQTVVLQGTGGVSLFALAFARMVGARVILTSSSDAKLERARALGADVTINYRTRPRWHEAVLEHTEGEGAHLVVEVGGGATLGSAVRAARIGGHVSVIGVLTGARAPEFPLNLVMARNVTLRGVTVGSTQQLAEMCRAVEQAAYRPVIDQRFTLETAHMALETLQAQGHFGKIVIGID